MTLAGKGPMIRWYDDGSITIDDWEIGVRDILYPHGTDLVADWRPISTAPHDGHWITVGWLERGRLRREADTRWSVAADSEGWEGGYFPTHWRPLS